MRKELIKMAVKKTELYSSLWASCDALRGGMDASQYKDYILTILFMKYVTDKYEGQKYGDLTVFDKSNDPEPDPKKGQVVLLMILSNLRIRRTSVRVWIKL